MFGGVDHIDSLKPHHTYPEGVWNASNLDLKKPKRVCHRPHPTAFPQHSGSWKRVKRLLADVRARRVVVSRVVLGRKDFSPKGFLRAGFKRPARHQHHASAN